MVSSSCSTTSTVFPRSRSFSVFDQFEIVTLVQSDGGFIQYIQNSLQPCSQLGSQTDTLGFATGKCCGRTVEIEVTDSDIVEETKTVPDFPEDISAYFFSRSFKSMNQKTDGFFQRSFGKTMDIFAVKKHCERGWIQPAAPAIRTFGSFLKFFERPLAKR